MEGADGVKEQNADDKKKQEPNEKDQKKDGDTGELSLEITGPGSGTKLDEINGGDTSLLSGDITIDSIRDHM